MEIVDSSTSCKNGEVWVASDPAFVECWGKTAGLLRTGPGHRNPRMSIEKLHCLQLNLVYVGVLSHGGNSGFL